MEKPMNALPLSAITTVDRPAYRGQRYALLRAPYWYTMARLKEQSNE
jgi:hypothetical protein